ncbi:Glycoside hydrolase family 3 domain protein [uncultured Eubacteriales bacterium]|uniref:beta-glucosidase n=1 Tax=uncultured Eubacteriales bacterium TaxID=172733 RepID=A0A212JCC9_9FIRM|nr:Glycoside hydrolase family 3 domain protein [uncultured Eubacteriales bacterium]
MKKQTKQALSLVLAGVMLMGALSGCTKKDPASTGSATPSGTTPPVTSGSYPMDVEELGSGTVKWSEEKTTDGWMQVTNEGGVTLGYSPESGIKLIQKDGYAFKDLNKNGKLDGYEDWRQDGDARTADIASQMTVEDVAGLMLYSAHQRDTTATLTEDQISFLDMGLRSVLNAAAANPTADQAEWANAMQAYVEGMGLGIPVGISTDPRSTGVSVWPGNFALASTFDPSIALEAANQLAKEYRAMGIGTLLGPQTDLSSEPRWSRVNGTYGDDPALSRDMAQAAVSGSQSTFDAGGADQGWGAESVLAMIKHWPGDGPGESGRESHNFWGKYNVYPGSSFETHLIPFVDGGFNLTDSSTGSAAAVMSSYSIAWDEDETYGELVGSAYSEYKIGLLRETYGFNGIICTDWGILADGTKTWGVDDLTPGERFYKALMAGVDQLGGFNDPAPILDAYEIGIDEIGEDAILARFQESGARLVRGFFLVGLFDNPYVSVSAAKEIVGNKEAQAAGMAAQQKSVIMLKNEGNTIKAAAGGDKPTVYIPMMYTPESVNNSGDVVPGAWTLPVDLKDANQYFNVVTDKLKDTFTGTPDKDGKATPAYEDIIRASKAELADCDYALAIVKNPQNGGNNGGYDKTTSTYVPISLQWGTYTANGVSVRSESLAGDMVDTEIADPYGVQKVQAKENRSYYGQSFTATNTTDLDAILYAADNMPETGKVVVAVNAGNPFIPAEFEAKADAILTGFGVNNKLFLGALAGEFEPTGLLPIQLPADMDAVETQLEDVPRDTKCYVDAAGNTYDFAFGLNWGGVIDDARTAKYKVDPLTAPANTGK